MKKLMLAGVLGVFALGVVSCGGHGSCDAYRSADYAKYKVKKEKQIELKGLIDVKKNNKKSK
jgi:hypothetical protein